MTEPPAVDVTPVSRPYWEGLKAGKLRFQHCRSCGNDWLPAREACPQCLSPEAIWVDARGRGTILSWVVYHRAYHPYFKDKLPYNVALVQLDEGPRLMTNIVGDGEPPRLAMGAGVVLHIEECDGLHLARFKMG